MIQKRITFTWSWNMLKEGGSVKDLVLLEELEKLLLRRYFRDVIAGLMYLHSHNIVHGDIKPENLLIDSNGRTKFCDFKCKSEF